MNTYFRSRCEPSFNHSVTQNHWHYCPSSCPGVKYHFSRNVPHPRTVHHILGLNNAPVCAVRDSFFREYPPAAKTAIKTAIPKQDANQERVRGANTPGTSPANSCLLRLESFLRRGPGSSQCAAQKGLATIPERTQSKPASPGKLLKRRSQTSAQPAAAQEVPQSLIQPCSSFVSSSQGPHVPQNANSDLSYLDWEIQVLDKLGKVLQTDSLTEIQEWLSKASIKEKSLMSRLIYSELTDKGMLNGHPHAMKEGAAENMNTHSLLKPQPPPRRGSAGGISNRLSTKESEASQNIKHGRDKDCNSFSRLKNRGPAHADTLSPEKNCGLSSAGNGNKAQTCPPMPSEFLSAKQQAKKQHLLSKIGPPLHSH